MSTNDITGARLVSKNNTKEYDEGYDRIFGKKNKQIEDECECLSERCVIHDNEVEVIND